jgi:O-antigen/teichoic acid export membrane protein
VFAQQSDLFLANAFISGSDLAKYTLAKTIASQIGNIVYSATSRFINVKISNCFLPGGDKRVVIKYLHNQVFVCLFLMIFYLFFSRFYIDSLYVGDWSGVSFYLVFFGAAFSVRLVSTPLVSFVICSRGMVVVFRNNVLSAAFGFILSLILVYFFGIFGLLSSIIAGAVFLMVLHYMVFRKL